MQIITYMLNLKCSLFSSRITVSLLSKKTRPTGQRQCSQISREKQASGPMKTSPKQAISPFVVKKKKRREIITLCTHTHITLNPKITLYLLLFLYVMILFCFSSRTSKQYDMQYNRKRNTLTTSPKTCNLRLPIFISDFTEKQAQSHL